MVQVTDAHILYTGTDKDNTKSMLFVIDTVSLRDPGVQHVEDAGQHVAVWRVYSTSAGMFS